VTDRRSATPSAGEVGPIARALGFAGLLPQVAAVVLIAVGTNYRIGELLALAYGGLILSFLGGMWWGFAMRRTEGQGSLVVLAVVPSLAALAITLTAGATGKASIALVVLGTAVLLTLLVDRHLAATNDAPAGWMRLRVPLSVGLGGLTILAGLL
jgi:hypothetical protein